VFALCGVSDVGSEKRSPAQPGLAVPRRPAAWVASAGVVHYIRGMGSATVKAIHCDGCGQVASAEHLAARFRRLEWATRHRPIHVNTLVLGGVVPAEDAEIVYADVLPFRGEAAGLLRVAGIDVAGKSADEIHHEFQRTGFFVAHVLDCPADGAEASAATLQEKIDKRLPATFTRIRRSIKPKRLVLLGSALDRFVENFRREELGSSLILDGDKTFKLLETDGGVERLRAALASTQTASR
jgi:hypothetical protein